MGTHCIVVPAPTLDHRLRFLKRVEDLAIEQFAAEFRIEAFSIAVLPGTARLGVGCFRPDRVDPIANCFGNELRAVIGSNVPRNTSQDEQVCVPERGSFNPNSSGI